MSHDSSWGRKEIKMKNLNVLKECSAWWSACIQSSGFFLQREKYVIYSTWWLQCRGWWRFRVHGRSRIHPQQAIRRVDHQAWRFPFFFFFLWFEIPDSPPWLPACSNDLEWSYSSLFSPTVHVCSKMSKNTSTMCSIQTHGAKDYCPSRERKKTSFDQAKAMHQDSPRTEATSEDWVRPTLVYRPSCAEYFMTEPVPVPSPELDSTDELTCKTAKQKRLMFIWTNGKSQEE